MHKDPTKRPCAGALRGKLEGLTEWWRAQYHPKKSIARDNQLEDDEWEFLQDQLEQLELAAGMDLKMPSAREMLGLEETKEPQVLTYEHSRTKKRETLIESKARGAGEPLGGRPKPDLADI